MNITELGKKHDIGTQLAGRIRGEIEQRFQQDKQNAQKWVLDRLLQHGELTEDAYKTLKTEYGFGDEVIHNIYSTKQTEFEAIYQKGFRELKDYLYTQGSLQSIYEYVQTEYGLGDPVLRQICQELDEQFQLDQAQSQQDIHHIIAAHGPLSSDAIANQLRQQNCLFGDAVVQVLIQKVVEARQAAYQVYRRAYAEVFRRGVLLLSEEDKQSLERKRQQDGMTLSDQEVKVITEEYESALSQYREQYRSILYRYDLSDRKHLELDDSERAELEQRRLALKLETEDVQFVEQQKIEQYRLDLRGYEQMLNEALQRQVTLDERDRKSLEDYRREHHLERQIVERIEARLLQPTEAFEKDIQRLIRHQHGQVVATEGLTDQVLEAIEQRRLAYNVTAQNAEALQHKVLDAYQSDLVIYRRAVAEALPTDLLLLLQVTRGQLDDLRRELDLSASATAKIEAEFADAIALYREFCLGLLQDNPNVTDEVLQEMHKTQQMLDLNDEIAIAIKVEVGQTLSQGYPPKLDVLQNSASIEEQELNDNAEDKTSLISKILFLAKSASGFINNESKNLPCSKQQIGIAVGISSILLLSSGYGLMRSENSENLASQIQAVGEPSKGLSRAQLYIPLVKLMIQSCIINNSDPKPIDDALLLLSNLRTEDFNEIVVSDFLELARQLQTVGHFQRSGHLLRLIPESNKNSEVIELLDTVDKNTINAAINEYQNGRFDIAVDYLNSILLNSEFNQQAKELEETWRREWNTNAVITDEIKKLADSNKRSDWVKAQEEYESLTNIHWKTEARSAYDIAGQKIESHDEQERLEQERQKARSNHQIPSSRGNVPSSSEPNLSRDNPSSSRRSSPSSSPPATTNNSTSTKSPASSWGEGSWGES